MVRKSVKNKTLNNVVFENFSIRQSFILLMLYLILYMSKKSFLISGPRRCLIQRQQIFRFEFLTSANVYPKLITGSTLAVLGRYPSQRVRL